MLLDLKNIIRIKLKEVYVKAKKTKSLYQANKTILLENLFWYRPFYLILKIFKKYGKVK